MSQVQSYTKKKKLTREEEYDIGNKIQMMVQADELRAKPHLTDEEKKFVAHADAHRAESMKAYNTLFDHNMGLVVNRAKFYKRQFNPNLDVDDLIQDGCIGLMTAIRKFDPSRGNKFSTVAYMWINQSIVRSANKTSRLVRLPENRVTQYTRMNRISEGCDDDISDTKMVQKYQDALNMSRKEVMNIRNAATLPMSLDYEYTSDDGESQTLQETMSSLFVEGSSESHALGTVMTRVVHDSLSKLGTETVDLVCSYVGMEDTQGRKLSPLEAKELYDLSQFRYRKLVRAGLEELRKDLVSKGFGFSDFTELFDV